MNNRLIAVVAASTLGLMASVAFAENLMVGGAAMFPNKDIVDNAVNSKDHTTLVAAVKAAGLVDTLSSAGPFTVFAPTNAAFDTNGSAETMRPRMIDDATAPLTLPSMGPLRQM